ncbi:N-6 DNA methylase [Candidatus Vampirococcus lugosii]|uniref:Type I Restriction Enzyme n=1 Tax=Candidatus Vampirococcus lugosii TaxID=2789015 RepID=A0ABS5QL15_9BACT|nr:Type I Restriction Enzyme [Candidatus Vampirococcus lugosii]
MVYTKEVLKKIFPNPEKSLLLFDNLENLKFYTKDGEEGKYYIKSLGRREEERLIYNETTGKSAPEEIVKQLYIDELIKKYKYPKKLIDTEVDVQFGREKYDHKRVDVVVYSDDNTTEKIVIELKAPGQKNDLEQLKSYLNAKGAPIGVALNGQVHTILYRPYPADFDTLGDIPKYGEEVEDLFKKKKTLSDLEEQDLSKVILDLEELVLAHTGFDAFEEIFKIIFAKLFDETEAKDRQNEELFFRKYGKNLQKTKDAIDELFESAKEEWQYDIFETTDKIKLSPEHLSLCVGLLENISLFGSDLRVIDDAFEYLIQKSSKGEKGQYFTPRVVIDMCVKMLNPGKKDYVIDTACGSAGFLVHTMKYVREKHFPKASDSDFRDRYAKKYLFGIDFDERTSKISRAIMLIAGDGKSHIFKLNSLDTNNWHKSPIKYELERSHLIQEFSDIKKDKENKESLKELKFDVLLANPPFAGKVADKRLLSDYDLGKNQKGKLVSQTSRHILFIERNLSVVKPGGRLAIVLPQGVFNNTSEEHIRDFIMKKARILSVVGLDQNAFKPHTGTKTSVLFLQKWKEDELDEGGNPKVKNYPIFFATSKLPFKDNSGDYVYKEDENENRVLQTDLMDIADAFVQWGKEQDFNFLSE